MKYKPTDIVHVSLYDRKVGRLALVNRRIYFEYDPSFLQLGLHISPLKLPLQSGAMVCEDQVFEGLFGVFNDSLPDGWGRLLLDRTLQKHKISPELLSPLDRLTHVGTNGMGALCYRPEVSTPNTNEAALDLAKLAEETQNVLRGEAEEILPKLTELAGSSSGARPKIMVGVSSDRQHIIQGHGELPKGYSHWMIKFASSSDIARISHVEYAYSLMAKAAGLIMPDTHLFTAQNGASFFGVKRFDRDGADRVHMLSLSGLIHADHRFPTLDYEMVLRASLMLTKDVQELHKMFRLAAFNLLSHNRDDHAKNFAFLMSPTGQWQTAPAYDLTFSSGPSGEQSMTVMGEGKAPDEDHLYELANKFDIKNSHSIIDEVRFAIRRWPEFADKAGVGQTTTQQIHNIIN